MKSKISRRVDSICFKFNRAYAKSLLLGLLREVYQGITTGIAKFPCSNHEFFRFKSDLLLFNGFDWWCCPVLHSFGGVSFRDAGDAPVTMS